MTKDKTAEKLLSIGKTVKRLNAEFPGLSISKIRYLEDEGLVKPRRTDGGYRLFSAADIARLREILRLQSEQFLPLAVIKERMREWRPGQVEAPRRVDGEKATPADGYDEAQTISDLLAQTDLSVDVIKSLESFGLVRIVDTEKGLALSAEDSSILKIFTELSKYGIEPRHLRMYENIAQRESLLFQQIFSPQLKHRSTELRRKSHGDLKSVVALMDGVKALMLKKSLKSADLI